MSGHRMLNELRALDEVSPPDLWDNIVNAAHEPEARSLPGIPERERHPFLLVAMAAIVVLAVAAGVAINRARPVPQATSPAFLPERSQVDPGPPTSHPGSETTPSTTTTPPAAIDGEARFGPPPGVPGIDGRLFIDPKGAWGGEWALEEFIFDGPLPIDGRADRLTLDLRVKDVVQLSWCGTPISGSGKIADGQLTMGKDWPHGFTSTCPEDTEGAEGMLGTMLLMNPEIYLSSDHELYLVYRDSYARFSRQP